MANGYPDVSMGQKQDTQLPDLQLPVYRGDNVPSGDQMAMTPQKRKVMAYLQALRQKRMQNQQQQGMQGPPMAPQGMPPQGGGMPPQY